MNRILIAALALALSACAVPPPAQTTTADPAPGTINVRMGGELQFLYGVHSAGR